MIAVIKKYYLIGGGTIYYFPKNETNPNDKIWIYRDLKNYNMVEVILKNKNILKQLSINSNIIGTEFLQTEEELNYQHLPTWIVYNNTQNNIHKTTLEWSNLTTASYDNKNGLLWDISSKITYQLRTIQNSILKLTKLYEKQLDSKIELKTFKENISFQDTHTNFIYEQFQHFLMDCSILKDYLSDFIFYYVINKKFINSKYKHKSSYGQLIEFIDNNIKKASEIEIYLRNINYENGWLRKMNTYRNLIVHSTPLTLAHNEIFILCNKLHIVDDLFIPIIHCPIPENPIEIKKSRDNMSFKDFEFRLKNFINLDNNISNIDCLTYSKETINNFTTLCNKLLEFSPIKGYIKIIRN